MDGVANEDDFNGIFGDPMLEEPDDNEKYKTRRSRTTQARSGLPYIRRTHNVGLNYSSATKKGKKKVVKRR